MNNIKDLYLRSIPHKDKVFWLDFNHDRKFLVIIATGNYINYYYDTCTNCTYVDFK